MLSSIKKRKIEREADDTPDIVKKHQKGSKNVKRKETVSESKVITKPSTDIPSQPPTEMSSESDVQDDAATEEEVVPKSFKDLVCIFNSYVTHASNYLQGNY